MEKCLLDILEEERRILRDIEAREEIISSIQSEYLGTFCDDIMCKYRQEAEGYKKQLASVREELKQYLMVLFK